MIENQDRDYLHLTKFLGNDKLLPYKKRKEMANSVVLG